MAEPEQKPGDQKLDAPQSAAARLLARIEALPTSRPVKLVAICAAGLAGLAAIVGNVDTIWKKFSSAFSPSNSASVLVRHRTYDRTADEAARFEASHARAPFEAHFVVRLSDPGRHLDAGVLRALQRLEVTAPGWSGQWIDRALAFADCLEPSDRRECHEGARWSVRLNNYGTTRPEPGTLVLDFGAYRTRVALPPLRWTVLDARTQNGGRVHAAAADMVVPITSPPMPVTLDAATLHPGVEAGLATLDLVVTNRRGRTVMISELRLEYSGPRSFCRDGESAVRVNVVGRIATSRGQMEQNSGLSDSTRFLLASNSSGTELRGEAIHSFGCGPDRIRVVAPILRGIPASSTERILVNFSESPLPQMLIAIPLVASLTGVRNRSGDGWQEGIFPIEVPVNGSGRESEEAASRTQDTTSSRPDPFDDQRAPPEPQR